jgi:hypothetical protein
MTEEQTPQIDIPECGELMINKIVGMQWTITSHVKLLGGSFALGDYVPDIGIVSAICKDGAKAHTDEAVNKGGYMVETKVMSNEQFALLQPRFKKQMINLLKAQLEGFEEYKDHNIETIADMEKDKLQNSKIMIPDLV